MLPLPDARPWTPEDPFLYDLEVTAGDRPGHVATWGCAPSGSGRTSGACPGCCSTGSRTSTPACSTRATGPTACYTAPSDDGDGARHRDDEAARFHHAAQAHQGRAAALVPPLRPARHAGVAGHGERRRPLPTAAVVTAPALRPAAARRPPLPVVRPRRRRGPASTGCEECGDTVEQLRNVGAASPCGCRSTRAGASSTPPRSSSGSAALDPTRPVDHASGWHDQGAGDLSSLHVYFRRFRVPRRAAGRRAPGAVEYGGYTLRVDGHASTTGTSATAGTARLRTSAGAFARLHDEQIGPPWPPACRATVYTQLVRRRGRAQRPAHLRPARAQDRRGVVRDAHPAAPGCRLRPISREVLHGPGWLPARHARGRGSSAPRCGRSRTAGSRRGCRARPRRTHGWPPSRTQWEPGSALR